MSAPAGTARLIEDGGAAGSSEEFFRSPQFLEAEGVTHTLVVELGESSSRIPVIVHQLDEAHERNPLDPGDHPMSYPASLDASSPYAYPGAEVTGRPIEPGDVDWSHTGLVSIFIRDRLGDPPALADGNDRSVVLVSDPELKRKSRMSDRQQIRKNEAAGYEVTHTPGPEASAEQRARFHAVYTETMDHLDAGELSHSHVRSA